MKAVYKYSFSTDELNCVASVVMPKGAQILSTDVEGNNFAVWAFVDTDAEDVRRHIAIVSTGAVIRPFLHRDPIFINRIDANSTQIEGFIFRFHAFDFGETPL